MPAYAVLRDIRPRFLQFKHTKKWQPLLESDGFGYISTPEHVTPHIGVTGRFLGFRTAEDEEAWGSRKLNRPPYMNRSKWGDLAECNRLDVFSDRRYMQA